MSDTVIRINGVNVEGVKPSGVKLTINNVDPFLIGERTNSYSATVKVPRTPSNDALFKAERWPNLYTKDDVYKATVYFSGLPSPFVTGQFVAQVKAEKTQYTISLVQNTVGFKNMLSPVSLRMGSTEVVPPTVDGKYEVHFIDNFYRYATLGVFSHPAIANIPSEPNDVKLGFDTQIRVVDISEVEGLMSNCEFLGAVNTIDGAYYPSYTFRPSNPLVERALTSFRPSSTPIYGGVDSGSEVYFDDAGLPEKIYMRAMQLTTDQCNIQFDKWSTVNGVSKYVCPNIHEFVYLARDFDMRFYFQGPTAAPPTDANTYRPTKTMPVENAMNVALGIRDFATVSGSQEISTEAPYDPKDLVLGTCQAFGWRYSYDYTTSNITATNIIAGHPTGTKTYIDWSDKINADTAVYSETTNLGAEMVVKVGEAEYIARGNKGNILRRTNAMNSSLAVVQNRYGAFPRVFDVKMVGGGYGEGEYFRHPSGYRKYIQEYFKPYEKSYQVTVKAKLSYFDIVAFKDDALYRFANLGGSFYLRTISNWDFSTGECTLTLISVDL
jgi:hypothetical protein